MSVAILLCKHPIFKTFFDCANSQTGLTALLPLQYALVFSPSGEVTLQYDS